MKKYTRVYLKFFGYGQDDFIPCEVCGNRANDIHHVDARGMGGDPTKSKDVIENLIALCRKHHIKYGDLPQYFDFLKKKHEEFMRTREL